MNAGYALTQPTFKYYCNEILLSNPEAGRWIDNIPVENGLGHTTMAKDGAHDNESY